MIKDTLKEIEALDARINELRSSEPAPAADPEDELLGSDSVGPAPDGEFAGAGALAELEAQRSELQIGRAHV